MSLAKRTAAVSALLAACAALPLGSGAPPANAAAEQCYFPSSFFCQRLAPDTRIDPGSAAMVAELRNMASGRGPDSPNGRTVTSRAGINYDAYAPMLYTVAADQWRVPVALDGGDPGLRAALAAGVPMPPEARPATGTDRQLIIYQPSTDTMWELWRARKDITGAWHATWGGVIPNVSENPGHYEDAVVGGYPERHTWGGPASGIPNLPGLITIEQLRSGVIGHALVFSTWANNSRHWVYPAQRTDGRCRGLTRQYCADVPQGARFRIDPNFDLSRIDNPIARMVAKAVQDYGMVLTNTTGSGFSFYAEGWRGHPESGDPYYGPGGLFADDPDQVATTQFMREFPWEHVQMLRRGTTCTDASLQCQMPAAWQD
ncbi:MAG: hypothetical protein QOI10_2569 [Solirubrobacterales bacterium]|jgi:hypothetical protein|nr:hypothetical protein [Solirubrobacterales bacterium]